jgi:hypothetical protein
MRRVYLKKKMCGHYFVSKHPRAWTFRGDKPVKPQQERSRCGENTLRQGSRISKVREKIRIRVKIGSWGRPI